jgi:AcrR family transcriptional regulator
MASGRLQRGIAPQDDSRRSAILRALFRCMRDRGYTATSLADVAAAAGISPSHLLYYFPNKDAVLEALFQAAADHMLRDVAGLAGGTPEEQWEALGDYFFGGRVMTRPEQAIMLQFFGLATHNPRLWQTKADFDRRLKERFTAIFAQAGGRSRRARDAAEAASALLVGLFTSSYFDEGLELSTAHRLFREAFVELTAR